MIRKRNCTQNIFMQTRSLISTESSFKFFILEMTLMIVRQAKFQFIKEVLVCKNMDLLYTYPFYLCALNGQRQKAITRNYYCGLYGLPVRLYVNVISSISVMLGTLAKKNTVIYPIICSKMGLSL